MTGKPPKPLVIEDDHLRDLVASLAARLGSTEEFAIKTAVEAELKRREAEQTPREKLDALLARFPKPSHDPKPVSTESHKGPSLKERLEDFYRRHPMPEPTGLAADKAFFDELSGEFD